MRTQAIPASFSDDAANLSWSHPRVLVTLALVFILGIALGAAGSHAFLHPPTIRPVNSAMRLMVLKRELNLTAEQEILVKKELDDYAKYYQNIEEERADVAMHGKQRILQVLTPEQQKKFNVLFDRFGK